MKLSKLNEKFRQKVRIKVTRAKRGQFEVVVPGLFVGRPEHPLVLTFPGKRQAMTGLLIQLRVMLPLIIEVRKKAIVRTPDDKSKRV